MKKRKAKEPTRESALGDVVDFLRRRLMQIDAYASAAATECSEDLPHVSEPEGRRTLYRIGHHVDLCADAVVDALDTSWEMLERLPPRPSKKHR